MQPSRAAALRGFLTSEAISMTGTRVSMIAIPWFVLTTTGSATQTGLVTLFEMAPLVAFKALAGPLVDRVGARRVAITCDVSSVFVVGLIPLLHTAGMLSFPVLLGLVAIAGTFRGPGDGARAAMVPPLAEHCDVPLERVTGLSSAVERTASMTGAAFAGGLVALVGPTNALIVDAGSFALSALVLWIFTPGIGVVAPVLTSSETSVSSYASELREGWNFLRRDAVLVGISVMVAITNLLDVAYSSLFVPVWAKESGSGVAAIGVLFAVTSGAAIVGSVIAAKWADRLPRFKTYLFAFLLCGAPRYVVLALGAPLWLILGVCVISGFASGFINPVLGAVIYERIPAPMMGRVSSLNTALCWSLIPFGGMLGGALVVGIGLAPGLLVAGGIYFATTMVPALQPRWREMDRKVPEPVSP